MGADGSVATLRLSARLRRLGLGLAAAGACCWLAAPAVAQSSGGESARYRLTFEGTWTRTATPGGLPGNAHFSPLIGAVHNDDLEVWRPGRTASAELEQVAEIGVNRRMRAFLERRGTQVLEVIEKDPGRGGTARTTIEFEATRTHSLFSLVTMIAPSPDWFVGVSRLSLLDGGEWLTSREVDLFPYDAGTEEGTEFSLDNAATVPRGTITSIRGMGKFTDAPMAKLTFELLESADPDDGDARFSGDVVATPTEDTAVTVSWSGEWAEPERGTLSIEARSQKTDWTRLVTVSAPDGQVRIDGLETGAPYTFRLGAEKAGGGLEYSEQVSATTGAYSDECRTGEEFLCLREGRFEVQVHWKNNERVGDYGIGRSVPVDVSDESGLFWFFNPDNIELVVKVLDGRRIDDHHWVFYGALSDVEYWITVQDVVAGVRRTYHNMQGRICGQNDTKAFPESGDSAFAATAAERGSMGSSGVDLLRIEALPFGPTGVAVPVERDGHCEPGPERLCVQDNRFSLEVRFIDPNESNPGVDPEKAATVVDSLTTAETGFFWFFTPSNIELAAKVLDGRANNGHFWLLYGGVSDVEYTLTVTDTVTGFTENYTNEQGSICGVVDTETF